MRHSDVQRTLLLLASLVSTLASAQTPSPSLALLTRDGVVLLVGETRTPVPGTAQAQTFAWDHDGRHLVTTEPGGLFRRALDGTSGERIASGDFRFPEVSPDGGTIAVATLEGERWRVVCFDRAGTKTDLGPGYDPSWSADGGHLYFEDYRPTARLFVRDLATDEIAPALAEGEEGHTVRASPCGRWLAWSRSRRLVLRDLEDGSERVLSPDDVYDRFPSFGPDGSHLVCYRQTRDGRDLVVRYELADGRETVLTRGDVQLADLAPPARRALADFVRLSRGPSDDRPLAELAGFDPREKPALYYEIAHAVENGARRPLFLHGVTTLIPGEAAALARSESGHLFLPVVRSLTHATVRALARYRGALFLDGVARLDVASARSLAARGRRTLSLRGLEQIDVATATALAEAGGPLMIGLRSLDPEVARALAAYRAWGQDHTLALDRLPHLGSDAAAALVPLECWGLSLGGLTELTPDVAGALGRLRLPFLSLGGLVEMPLDVARIIGTWQQKFLYLDGLRHVTPEVRALLEEGSEALSLNGL